MPLDLKEIAGQVRAVTAQYGRAPYLLRVGPATYHDLMRVMWTQDPHPPVRSFTPIEDQGPFGMQADVDPYLPAGVWRLADEYGTLLYDCRQGKVVP